ncbi:hypothetical protein ZWY2020_057480 [Hordeum vulgare]|nr:hypothetical protein ZWY2020_057480 [Hordeum vulgare]
MMDAADVLAALVPSWSAAVVLASYLVYLAAAGLFLLLLLLGLSALGVYMDWMTPIVSFCSISPLAPTCRHSVS